MITLTAHTQRLIDDLAHAVVSDGLSAHRPAVAALADQAQVLGIAPTLIALLLDAAEPDVVRERAFGAVTRELASRLDCERSTDVPATAAVPAHRSYLLV